MPFKKWLRRVALFPLMVFMGGIPEGDGTAPTAAESEARAKGWRPQEEFSGDATKWVDHEEFLKRSDLYHTIGKMNQTLKKRDKEIEAIVNYTKQQTEAAYQRGLQEAHGRLDAAVEAKDPAAVREITKEIVQLEQQKPAPAAQSEELPEEVQDFQERNASWFDKDAKMTRVAIALAQQFAEEHPRMSVTKRLQMVEDEMAEMYPAKFTARREAPPAVEGAGQPGERAGGKTKYSPTKLSAEERMVHDQYVRRGVMTSEAYFKSLEEIEPGRFGK